jgi:hypothetical protein
MVGQANIINRFAGVHMEDIRGIRVPFLRVGWNRQFLMMKEFGFVYDASMAAPLSDPPLWPYTLDYKMPHGCVGTGQRCPSRSFPGIWEMVLNQLEVEVCIFLRFYAHWHRSLLALTQICPFSFFFLFTF